MCHGGLGIDRQLEGVQVPESEVLIGLVVMYLHPVRVHGYQVHLPTEGDVSTRYRQTAIDLSPQFGAFQSVEDGLYAGDLRQFLLGSPTMEQLVGHLVHLVTVIPALATTFITSLLRLLSGLGIEIHHIVDGNRPPPALGDGYLGSVDKNGIILYDIGVRFRYGCDQVLRQMPEEG